MVRLTCFSCAAILFLVSANPQQKMFAKYKSIQAYEIRPGVLAIPRLTVNGDLCAIQVERIGSNFLQHEIDQIVDELVPVAERGRRWKGLDYKLAMGLGYKDEKVYEDVTIDSFGNIGNFLSKGVSPLDYKATGPSVFIIIWTKRKCR